MVNFIFSKSQVMQNVLSQVKRYAETELPVFIEGETGTGKSLLAQKIHELSNWSGNFQKFDCATFNSNLVESELFGHEKGSFTGAVEKKSGLFELACGGTVFLDEIENIRPEIQTKLLGVLDEKKFRRIGGEQEIEVYFRLISTTNRNIQELLDGGGFRKDLYFRLNGVNIKLPPLKECKEDIWELFYEQIKQEFLSP